MRVGLADDAWQRGVRFNCMMGTSYITFERITGLGRLGRLGSSSSAATAAADAEATVATAEQAAALSRTLSWSSKREHHICL